MKLFIINTFKAREAINKTGMNKIIFFFFIVILITVFSCKQQYKNPHIIIETTFGNIELELYQNKAPKTVSSFLSYIDSGYFDHCSFYRVLNDDNQPSNAPKTELIQGGIWKTKNKLATRLKGIEHESTKQTGILHKNGTISLARLAPGTASTEFFICVGDQLGLDYGGENVEDHQGYAAFGHVVKGMEVVKKIYTQNDDGQYFDPPIIIINIERE